MHAPQTRYDSLYADLGLIFAQTRTHIFIHTYMHNRHDTTAFMLSWTLIEIYRNPKVLESLRTELDAANPERTHWTPDHLRSLKYLDAAINEGMR
jgi:cytochrome P450